MASLSAQQRDVCEDIPNPRACVVNDVRTPRRLVPWSPERGGGDIIETREPAVALEPYGRVRLHAPADRACTRRTVWSTPSFGREIRNARPLVVVVVVVVVVVLMMTDSLHLLGHALPVAISKRSSPFLKVAFRSSLARGVRSVSRSPPFAVNVTTSSSNGGSVALRQGLAPVESACFHVSSMSFADSKYFVAASSSRSPACSVGVRTLCAARITLLILLRASP